MKFELTLPGKKMRDDVFCLTEERNYFESKFLEQISEIADLRMQLRMSKREVTRLRGQLMGGSFRSLPLTRKGFKTIPEINKHREKKEKICLNRINRNKS
mmetsp:Transcript_41143/g.46755  ORF Transcript_41143/g.46755 Transcript_41143/m.46755 type:complete len:100 (+) Transcript_41143:271-570(+)